MPARIGVVVFPGSNCEHDMIEALEAIPAPREISAELLWHADPHLGGCDGVVIPGGFAHGDYLRPGAIARFSPIMAAVIEFAASGGPVVGVCNGFQILAEAGLVPGALRPNAGLRFVCESSELEVVSTRSVLTSAAEQGQTLRIPINHYEGNYTCDPETLAQLVAQDQIVVRYTENPNGSVGSIAGVSNVAGNVVGLMPHPERASGALLGSSDGLVLLQSLAAEAVTFAQRGAEPRRMPAFSSTAAGTPASRQVE